MCGIVGYLGSRDATNVLLDGLTRLEYRGYDSAGIAVLTENTLACRKAAGKLTNLKDAVASSPLPGHLGIGHTRWATHGAPTKANAHPHLDTRQRLAVVHNGIIENHAAIRARLQAEGVTFRSETDTEVLAHLIRKHYTDDLSAAVRATLAQVEGAYALAVLSLDEPGTLVAARQGSPLVLGIGEGEYFLGSDVSPLLPYTKQVVYLDEGDVCTLNAHGYAITQLDGAPVDHPVKTVKMDAAAAEKEGYPHFMLKEIHQQPDVIRHALVTYLPGDADEIHFPNLDTLDDALTGITRIVAVACGTAWHAALVGQYWMEGFARMPMEVALASEFRYRNPVLDEQTLVIAVSQSGETADTLEAVRMARAAGARVLALVNVPGSSIDREADGRIYLHAGPEIGVASTKAYTAQLTVLALFALHLAKARRAMDAATVSTHLAALRDIPTLVSATIAAQDPIIALANKTIYREASHAMFIGRSYNYPSALEGALKLKEISYIHVEGYAAGEMKHGPIALVTDHIPVVCIAVAGETYAKLVSNVQEIRARNGIVLSIATEGDTEAATYSDDVLYVPACAEAFSPLVVAPPLQLLAYHIACALGRDVDQPRNLAKSVTVE